MATSWRERGFVQDSEDEEGPSPPATEPQNPPQDPAEHADEVDLVPVDEKHVGKEQDEGQPEEVAHSGKSDEEIIATKTPGNSRTIEDLRNIGPSRKEIREVEALIRSAMSTPKNFVSRDPLVMNKSSSSNSQIGSRPTSTLRLVGFPMVLKKQP